MSLRLRISVSTFAVKMLAKATDILKPIAVPWVCIDSLYLALNCNEFSCRISLSACSSQRCRDRSFILVEGRVRSAYCFTPLLLWYVCV